MSALILALMAYTKKDGHVIFTSDCYRQTRDFATNQLPRFGVQASFAEPNAAAIERAIRPAPASSSPNRRRTPTCGCWTSRPS